ncbi:hypothetical protein C1645_748724 [Glomus cerebriforme]|uniref:Uncharacterized protein n=1 Tax=Glomus cerebriforme TaxID=658196 RepID=A0A397TMX7_9GLOM|nr:hypothetical protein C1645_748724 [Glomus cerebriforme]
MEDNLISNNIFSIRNIKSFPFIYKSVDDFNNKDNIHFIIKCERYEILINKDYIEPSTEFNNAIEEALDSMKPFNRLQDLFNEYGHLFPLRIILGRSLKNITTTTFFGNFEKINLKLPLTKDINSYLDTLNISYLLTKNGEVIDEKNLDDWIQKSYDELQIIEWDEIISFYDILKSEQRRKIDIILNHNNENNYKIIMTGINDLTTDLINNETKYYKRIKINPSLEVEKYEVFGSVVTKNHLKIENVFIKFGLYDVNGFSAIIETSNNIKINISECYILWIIIGNPLKLSVFSPKNREFQVDCINKPITLQPNISIYSIKTPFRLSQGYTILINVNCSMTDESTTIIKLVEWSYNSINFEIKSNDDEPDIDLHICILHSDYKNLKIDKIDNIEMECLLDSFGYVLTEKNLNKDAFYEFDKFDNIKNIIKQSFMDDDIKILNAQAEDIIPPPEDEPTIENQEKLDEILDVNYDVNYDDIDDINYIISESLDDCIIKS